MVDEEQRWHDFMGNLGNFMGYMGERVVEFSILIYFSFNYYNIVD